MKNMLAEDAALGVKVECVVTGFKGISIGRCEYLNGCTQVLVKPRSKKAGEMREGQWVDYNQLRIVGEGVVNAGIATTTTRPGGPDSNQRRT